MTQQIGIISDDLTGANDSGVQLTKKGIHTSVLFDIPKRNKNFNHGLVIDTNSRMLTRQEAADVTKQAGEFLKENGYQIIYKKMDSTLRGHIGIELKALQDVFKPEFVFIAPAFPSMGRITKDGIHYIHNIQLSDTEIANDPTHPVTNSFIPGIIKEEIHQDVGLLNKSDIYGNMSLFTKKLKDYKNKGIRYIVCDAEEQQDLHEAATKMNKITNNLIWAGSAGLAEVLPDVLNLGGETNDVAPLHSKQVMTVCGSLSQVTQEQVQFAASQPNITTVRLDPIKFLSNESDEYKSIYVRQCLDGFTTGNDVVIYVPSSDQVREQVQKIGDTLNLTNNEIGAIISKSIGKIVKDVAQNNLDLNGFVLTGGDTAKDTSYHLGGIGFQLIKELETGLPLGRFIGTNQEYMVVTKAGAFGKDHSIYNAMMALKGDC